MNVVFDGENLLIRVNSEVTTLDVQTDIYSTWKQWIREADNTKFLPALRTIGGDPTIGEKAVAPYFFLTNGWKIKPYSWNHTLNLIGNLFVDEPETYGSNVVVPSDGYFTVLVNMSTTSDASKLLVGSGVTSQDKLDISKGVWDETRGAEVLSKTSQNLQVNGGRWKIQNNQMIFYDSDNVTPLMTFDLKNKQGVPSETDVYERVPV